MMKYMVLWSCLFLHNLLGMFCWKGKEIYEKQGQGDVRRRANQNPMTRRCFSTLKSLKIGNMMITYEVCSMYLAYKCIHVFLETD